ncbi:MAG: hypothetical protein R3E32_25095 [Chitinophagales bacterium]
MHHFEGFYGLEDSIVQMIEDSIQSFAVKYKGNEELKEFLEDYRFLKAKNLLHKPCKYLLTENKQPIRVYFTEADFLKIEETRWFSKMKVERKQTYLKMKMNRIKEKTFFCEEILETVQE